MPGPIRLLICDIDGTLVRRDKSLPDENVAALQDLIQRGVAVSLISARPPSGMIPIAEQIGLAGPFGAFNGGTIFTATGSLADEERVPGELAAKLLALFAEAGVTRWLFSGGKWYASDATNPHIPREVLSSALQPIETADFAPCLVDVDKLVAVSDDPALVARLEGEARALAGGTATVVRSQPYFLDVTALKANKGDGVTALAELYGVPLAEVAVIGDQANDIAMFHRAGLAIAMGQATDEVKAEADAITASNEAAGVAEAVRRLILPRVQSFQA